nr:reverse transcriptase domain-containing protein [Tanacetum cinerariifolium]
MSTRSSARNLFPPLDNPELTIRRRSHADPTLLNEFEMAAEENGDPLVPDLRTMEELCQPSLNGRGGPIAPIAIQAMNFGLKNDMIQQVQNSCQLHGLPSDDANKHLDKFLHVTQSINVNGVTDDALRLYLFPHSLTHHATTWFDRLPRKSNKNLMDINIDALYNILKQNQRDVNDAMGSKKKTVVVTFDPLALIAEKTNVSRSKEKVVVSLDSEGSEADDFSELKKITALLAKSFNRRIFFSNPTNNNLRTSSTSQSANKKQEFVKLDDKKVEKKADEKKRDMSRVKCYNYKKEGHFAKHCKKAKVKDYEYYKLRCCLQRKIKMNKFFG